MPAHAAEHPATPLAEYLRTIWASRVLFAVIALGAVAVAAGLAFFLPKTYRSEAMVSVQSPLLLESSSMLYEGVLAAQPRDQRPFVPPTRFERRLRANRTVTLAARDAGVIGAADTIDDRQIGKWVDVKHVEGTDLLIVAVEQRTPETAQRFVGRLIDRTMELEAQHLQSDIAQTRALLTSELQKATAAVAEAERTAVVAPAGDKLRTQRAELELTLARDTYAAVRKRLAAINLVAAEQTATMRVVDPPTPPLRPVFPQPVLFISLGLIVGIVAATLIIVLRAVLAAPAPRAAFEPAEAAVGGRLPRTR